MICHYIVGAHWARNIWTHFVEIWSINVLSTGIAGTTQTQIVDGQPIRDMDIRARYRHEGMPVLSLERLCMPRFVGEEDQSVLIKS